MPAFQSPELLRLFETYTGGPAGIGAQLNRAFAATTAGDPLIVATNSDFVLFPGNGRDPEVEGFRLATRGFKEQAGVSHLGPAVATILRLRELQPGSTSWRDEAQRLLASTRAAREANNVELWRDRIAVAAWKGREDAIARMAGYACRATECYLERVLRSPESFTREDLRERLLEAHGPGEVPLNKMMIATFFLVALDIAHRAITWFDRRALDWPRAMVVIAGRQGRPTAGVTWASNSVAAMVLGASRGRLPLDRLYIAPHAPAIAVTQPVDPNALRAFEQPMRELWCHTRATSELGPLMYEGYPAYAPESARRPVLRPDTRTVADMPQVDGPDDWRALNTRLRVVMEDPRQLLSGCVSDYAVAQLVEADNDPAKVVVPGLDGMDYPDA